MITFRKALLVAASVLTFLYLFRSSHTSSLASPSVDQNVIQEKEPSQRISDADSPSKPPITGRTNYNPTSTWQAKRPERVKVTSKQTVMTSRGGGSLRDQLAYQFPYDVEAKFPAYVWQTWKHTPASGEFAEDLRPAEASWTEKHPTFVHEVVTDQAAVHLMRYLYASVPDVMEAYQALPLPVMKADFFRYLILLARGGIYSDIDTTALKPAYEWVPATIPRSAFGLVLGIEADPDRQDWAQWYSRRIQFCQWTIQAKPGHPVLVDIVANITEETLRRKKAGKLDASGSSVVESTGPALWTDRVFEYFNNAEYFDMNSSSGNMTWRNFTGLSQPTQVGDVVVLPITAFSPGVGQMGAKEPDDPMACVKHEFHGSWKPESERHIGEPTAQQS
ncbi:MAG: membrane-bound alpha-1,6- mannosyltransferase Initiation-specific [Peltula sp. TS41687]|nr:MAG: membrane-bound alpha-1,6- mannosyltransferase Initiation-specific [Peltula sp. TS41687]